MVVGWSLVQIDGHKRGHYEGDTVVDTVSRRYLRGISQACHCLFAAQILKQLACVFRVLRLEITVVVDMRYR
jgi:hypothetical protein